MAAKRKRYAYIKKRTREESKNEQIERTARQEETESIDYEIWNEQNIQSEKLSVAMQCLNAKERKIVVMYVLHKTTFKELAKGMHLTEKGVASIYYRSIKKMRHAGD